MSGLPQLCPPVLSPGAARDLERRVLGEAEAAEWAAMRAAGTAIAESLQRDCREIGGFNAEGRLLVLAGKGHNGGDALIAARVLAEQYDRLRVAVILVFGERTLRPLAARAWRELAAVGRDRVTTCDSTHVGWGRMSYDICLDGIFGFQFRPPAEPRVAQLIAAVNALPIGVRAAVDLPSADLFHADFTYATGSVKDSLLRSEAAGRVRLLDLGFFQSDPGEESAPDRVLTTAVLQPLAGLRPPRSDKRTYGHVFLLGGSRGFPGAILMATMAAIRSGAGLVTSFVPESLAPSFAARLPEAIWVGWPETPAGGLALEGEHLLRECVERANALVIGPGIGREPETLALVQSIAVASGVPLALDADALQPEIVTAGNAPRVVTPHAGEFKRIAAGADLRNFASRHPALTVVLKGPITQVCGGQTVYHSWFGGPVLARGGSGDLLSGMMGVQLAQNPADPLLAAARAVVWHGHAADCLARARGQVAVATTELLDYLEPALRG